MSIAFERSSGDSIQNSGFGNRMPPRFVGGAVPGDQLFPAVDMRKEEEEEDSDVCSSSSSSIGRNSDASGDEDSGEDCEVQSSYKGPLDTMDALEEVLPIKRGISKFYNGKSKSFTSLADASSAFSIKDFAKPENPNVRKRKNLLSCSTLWGDKNRSHPPKDNGSCISKRPATSNRRLMALGSTIDSLERNNKREETRPISSSPSSCLPPLHPHAKTSPSNGSCVPLPQKNSKWRSFSLSDLQSCNF